RVATDIAGTIRVTLEGGWSVEAAGAAFGTTGLQPTVSFQHGVEHDRGHQHKEQRGRVTEDPVELWHVLEVHPVDCANQRRSKQDRRPGRDFLDLLVLRVAGLGTL